MPGGGRHRAVSRDGPAGGPQSCLLVARQTSFGLCRRFWASQRRDGARWRRDPKLGLRPLLRLGAATQRSEFKSTIPGRNSEGPGDPYLAPCSALGCNS